MKDFVLYGYLSYAIYGGNIMESAVHETYGEVIAYIKKPNTFTKRVLGSMGLGGAIREPKPKIVFI